MLCRPYLRKKSYQFSPFAQDNEVLLIKNINCNSIVKYPLVGHQKPKNCYEGRNINPPR